MPSLTCQVEKANEEMANDIPMLAGVSTFARLTASAVPCESLFTGMVSERDHVEAFEGAPHLIAPSDVPM
jgi:hypothetical protein